MKFIFNRRSILLLLLSGLIFRISLSFFGTLQLDFNTFVAWSNSLLTGGFSNFYLSWSDYLPGYLYILWGLAFIKDKIDAIPTDLLYKLPAILADLVTGFLIYEISLSIKKSEKLALISSSIYLFNPAIIANSTLWGQVDSITALFSLLTVYFSTKNIFLSAIFLGFGSTVKLQVILSGLVVFYLAIKNKWKLRSYLVYPLSVLLVFSATFIPFAGGRDLTGFILERLTTTLNQYPYTSVNAFNFWGIFGLWKPDNDFLIPPMVLGILAVFSVFVLFFRKNWRKQGEYLLMAGIFSASFLFFPRMHERHLLFAFAPLVISTNIIPSLILVYIAFSLTYLLNLYYSFVWITQDFKNILPQTLISFLGLINVFSLLFFLKESISRKTIPINISALTKAIKSLRKTNNKFSFPKIKVDGRLFNWLLIGIFLFSLTSRLLFLNKPEKEYFDEVYHAFTARVMKDGDPKGWEWWNPHPEGFAYEWTHPPLAKLGMWLGMSFMGENSLGWRVPGALLGTLSILLVYSITQAVFKDKLLSILAAVVYSLDGLPLVMSRIGMNDSYLMFFILLSIFLFIKDKYLLSSLFFGLALSSKWSAIWAVPIFLIGFLLFKKKFNMMLLAFIFIPLLVYLASYIPMFMVGDHTFQTFIDVQKQMWWYHTGLDATHPYTSLWYTWPFLIRPIWLYTSGLTNGMIANIYAMGNPIVFWGGISSMFIVLYYFLKSHDKKLMFIIFSYLVFFVPWALSPRIMFLYHYLPSLPFLSILLAIVLRKNLKLVFPFLLLTFLFFVYFYPHWTGISIPESLDKSYYWFSSWR